MPTMVFVLVISGAIHLTHYYRKAIVSDGLDVAPVRMVQAAWLPCGLTASTTAIGLASLMVSEVIPVKEFGMYASIGVLLSLPVLFLLLPSMLQMFPVVPTRKFERQAMLAEQQLRAGDAI